MAWKTFPAIVRSKRYVTPSVLHVVLERADGQAFEFTAGQFVNLHFDSNGESVHRSYSAAIPPAGEPAIEFAVAPVEGGLATALLFNAEPGDQLEVSGPYGRFVLRDDPPCRYVLVATNTGVTPYRSMLPEISKRLEDPLVSVDLLLGVRNREELLYGDEFLAFARAHERFRYFACLSRETTELLGHERKGYVQHQFEEIAPDPDTDLFYLCGNPDMVDEAFTCLKDAGFKTTQVRREKYLPARRKAG